METIRLKAHVGEDGILKLEIPARVTNRELEVVIVMQPMEQSSVDALGWPVGFFDRTYGALADNPIDRGEEPPHDVRDELE